MDDWRESLPEDLKSSKALEPFQITEGEEPVSVPHGLVKSYVEQQPLIGSKLKMPGEDAPQEEWDSFHEALGRPKTPDEYEFNKDSIPEGVPFSEDMEKRFRDTAHKLGVTGKQAQQLFDWYLTENKGVLDAYEAEAEKQFTEGKDALAKEWGDDYDANMKMAHKAFRTFFPEDAQDSINALLGNHPGFLKALHQIGKTTGEDNLVGEPESPQGGQVKSRDELRAMMKDPRFQTDAAYRKAVYDEYKKTFPGQHVTGQTGPGETPAGEPVK